MENENEVEELEDEPEDSDTTDWKAKYKEQGIRTRERTKSLKDEIAALKAKPEVKTDDGLLRKVSLKMAGITADDEKELADAIQKKTGLDWDSLVEDDYFKSKLETLRTTKANADATADIKGSGSGGAKNTVEYYLAKGEAPIHDKKLHSEYVQAKLKEGRAGTGKKFYNE
jgi:hypothetical protein